MDVTGLTYISKQQYAQAFQAWAKYVRLRANEHVYGRRAADKAFMQFLGRNTVEKQHIGFSGRRLGKEYRVTPTVKNRVVMLNGPHSYTVLKMLEVKKDMWK